MLKLKIFFLSFILIFCFAQKAYAHATPLEYIPAASSVLAEPPKEINIRFSERLEPGASSITVFGPDGKDLALGSAQVDKADPHIFHLPFGAASNGSYTVSWQVVSRDDGHFTKGAFVFSVGEASKTGTETQAGFQIFHSSQLAEAVSIGVEMVGQALLLGVLACLFWLWPRMKKRLGGSLEVEEAEKILASRAKKAVIISAGLVLTSVATYFFIKTANLSAVQATGSAWQNFGSTAAARYALLRLGLSLLLCVLLYLDLRKSVINFGKTKKTVYIVILFLIALARARVSHAAASHFAPEFSVLANAVHLVFKDLWIGTLVAFLILFSGWNKKFSSKNFYLLSLIDFSKITAVALAVAGFFGSYIVWLHLKSWDNLLLSDWGVRFLLLSAFAAVFLSVRVILQGILHKQILNKKAWAKDFLSLLLPMEAVFGVFILLITGQLIITTPPVTSPEVFSKTQISQSLKLELAQSSIEQGKMQIEVLDLSNRPVEVKNLVITLTNTEKGIGPIVAENIQRSGSSFVFDQNLLNPDGQWQVEITAQRQSGYDGAAKFEINTQKDLPSNLTESKKHLDSFAWVFILAGLLSLIFGLGLFLHARLQSFNAEPEAINNLSLYQAPSFILALCLCLILLQVLVGQGGSGHGGVLQSSFQKLCEQKGDMWHSSVPMLRGKALSAESKNGCMVGLGLGANHFVDLEEYKYFTRPAQANVYLEALPKELKAGEEAKIKISIKDLDGKPITELSLDHDRILHTIIINQDFSVFRHIHTEDFPELNKNSIEKGEFVLPFIFPKAGKYLVAADYMVRNKVFSESFYVNATGASKIADVIPSPDALDGIYIQKKNFQGLDVTLRLDTKQLKAKEKIDLVYTFLQNGQPVKNLESYLAVPMHVAVVRQDLLNFQHVHGWLPFSFMDKLTGQTVHAQHLALPKNFGPQITTQIVFPTAGIYHIFGQIKQNGKVIDTHFAVKVQ